MSGNPTGGTPQQAKIDLIVNAVGLQEAQQLVQGLAKAIEQSDAALQKMQADMVKLANQMAQQSGSGASFQSYPQVAQHLASSGYSNVQQLKAVSPPAYQLMSNIQSTQQAAHAQALHALQQPAMAQHVAAQHGAMSQQQLVQSLAQRVQLYHATGGNPQAWSGSIGGTASPPPPPGGAPPPPPPGAPPPGPPPQQQMLGALRQQYQRYQLQRQGVLHAAQLPEKQGGFDATTKATLGAQGLGDVGFLQTTLAQPAMAGKAPAVRKALDELAALDKRITQHFNDVYSTLRQANSQIGQTPSGQAQVIGGALHSLTHEDRQMHQFAVVQSLRQWAITGGMPAYQQAQQGALGAARGAGLPGYPAGMGPVDMKTLQQTWGQLSPGQQQGMPKLAQAMDNLAKVDQQLIAALNGMMQHPQFSSAAAAATTGALPQGMAPLQAMLQQSLPTSGGKTLFDLSDGSMGKLGGILSRVGWSGMRGGLGGSMGTMGAQGLPQLLGMLGLAGGAGTLVTGGILAALGVGEAISSNRAGFQRQTTALQANTANVGNPMALGLNLAAIGSQFGFDRTTSEGVGAQLGLGGVYGAAKLQGATQATLGLAAVSGMRPQDIAPLTASMYNAGQTTDQVTQTFADLQSGAHDAGTSLGQLIQDLGTLEQSTGNAAISASGLAAVQGMAPRGVNIGQALAPAMGARGFDVFSQAGMLGVSVDKYMQMQGFSIDPKTGKAVQGKAQPQLLWDAAAHFIQRQGVPRTAAGVAETEGILSRAGIDLSSYSPAQAGQIAWTMMTQGPKAAEKAKTKIDQQINKQGASGKDWLQTAAASGRGQVDALTIMAQKVDLVWTTALNAGPVAAGTEINKLATTPAGQALRAGVAALPGLGPVTSVLGALGALFGGGSSKHHPGGAGSDVGLGAMGGGVRSQQVGISLSGTLQVNDAHGRNVGRVHIDNSRQPVGSKTAVVKLHPLSQAHVPPHGARPS